MSLSDASLVAHSRAEIHLYLQVTRCPSCGRGPLHGEEADPGVTSSSGRILEAAATCGLCQAVTRWAFRLPGPSQPVPADQAEVVNPTDEPSRMLDVAQWLTLFGMMTEAAGKELTKVAARRLSLKAAQCLDEALKFYEEDNDLPPNNAFFQEESRERFRNHPQQFSRQRLLHLRSKLPTHWPMRPAEG